MTKIAPDVEKLRLVNAAMKSLDVIAEALVDGQGNVEYGEATTAAVAAAIAGFRAWTGDQGGTLEDLLELVREVWGDLKL